MPPGCPWTEGKTWNFSPTTVRPDSTVQVQHSVESVARSVRSAAEQPQSKRSPVRCKPCIFIPPQVRPIDLNYGCDTATHRLGTRSLVRGARVCAVHLALR